MYNKIRNVLPKVRKILNLLIQASIFLASCFFIYRQVFLKKDLGALLQMIEQDIARPGFLTGLVLVILLMPVNWGIETFKWRYLIAKVEEVGFLRAFQAVLTGISISAFIPNRVGEYFGRIFILRTASRIEGILITIVGSLSQLLITLVAGSAAVLAFLPQYFPGTLFGHGYLYYSLCVGVAALDLLVVALFFRLSFLTALKERILQGGLKRLRKFFRIFGFYHNRELATVLSLSAARYLVFSTQYYLLLLLFGIRLPYFQALMLIAILYLIMTLVPTVTLAELGIRGSVAIYLFGLGTASALLPAADRNLGVFAASALLWLINLVIPALAGTLLVFRLQFLRKNDL